MGEREAAHAQQPDDGGQLLVAEDRHVQQPLVRNGLRPGDAVEPGLPDRLRHRGELSRVRGPDVQGAAADLGLQLVDPAPGDDLPPVDDRQLLGELLGLLHILRGQQDGGALGDHPLHLVPDLVTGPGVEPRRRLVQIQHGRAADHRGGQVEAAAHPAGVLHGRPLGGLGEREPLQQLVGAGPGLLAGQIEQPPDHVEVLPAGELLVDRGVLPGEADDAAQLAGLLHHVVARDDRVPGVGGDQGGQAAYEGGLAGAVGAEHTEDGALAHIEVHAVQSFGLAVVLDQPPHLDGVPAAAGVLVDAFHAHQQTSARRQLTDRPPTRAPAGLRTRDSPPMGDVGGLSVVREMAGGSRRQGAAAAGWISGRCAPPPGTCPRRPRPRTPSPRHRGPGADSRTAW